MKYTNKRFYTVINGKKYYGQIDSEPDKIDEVTTVVVRFDDGGVTAIDVDELRIMKSVENHHREIDPILDRFMAFI